MIAISGITGFLGSNCVKHFEAFGLPFFGVNLRQTLPKKFSEDVTTVLHLAGKAHDLKNVAEPEEYFQVNTELTKQLFEVFLNSNAHTFIYVSSVKAIADTIEKDVLLESDIPKPITPYGESKLAAEKYLLSHPLSADKKLFILRPCMIHGPGNKGNLNLLYKLVIKGFPWPLGAFANKRSFLSIDNFYFVIDKILSGDLKPGVYNLADTNTLSTNEIIRLISEVTNKQPVVWKIPKSIIFILANLGSLVRLPLNTERLQKLTENYIVCNQKLLNALGMPLPVSAHEGLKKTFKSFE